MLTQEPSRGNLREKGGKPKFPGLGRETKPGAYKNTTIWDVYV